MVRSEKIALVGSGFVGRSWAMLFASVGYDVCLYDVKQEQVSAALKDIEQQLHELEATGLLRGKTNAANQFKRIRGVTNLKECVEGAYLVQESVFEDLEVKKKVWQEVDKLVGPNTVLASSSSNIYPSKLSADLVNKANFILSHPVNPPYYVPMVEVVPAPWTKQEVIEFIRKLLKEIGQAPVVVNREYPGFASNRIQYTILNECNSLVQSGVLSADSVDALVRHGLGHSWAFMGPLETLLLNSDAEGMGDYLKQHGAEMKAVSETLQTQPSWKIEDCTELITQLDQMVPQQQLEERRGWRNGRLAALAKHKKETSEQEQSTKN